MKKLEEIKNIAVIGAGTMGPGMALVLAHHGYQVKLLSRRQ
jgi:3-hydroxyacyl-CoA dehydrogenase